MKSGSVSNRRQPRGLRLPEDVNGVGAVLALDTFFPLCYYVSKVVGRWMLRQNRKWFRIPHLFIQGVG